MQLILDLDETLIHSSEEKPEKYDFIIDGLYVIIRRHTRKFLRSQERLIVWSAGEHDYVHAICKELEKRFKVKFDTILTRNDCERRISNDSLFYTKPLGKIFKLYPDLSYDNTLLLDDTFINMYDSPLNHLHIKPFVGKQDNELLNVLKDII